MNYISRQALRSEQRSLPGKAYVPEAGSPAARMASQRGEPLHCAGYLGCGRALGTNLVRAAMAGRYHSGECWAQEGVWSGDCNRGSN